MTEVEIQTGFKPGTIGRVVELHAQYYSAHWGFGTYFEALEAGELSDYALKYEPNRDRIFLAVKQGEIVGSIAIDGKPEGQGNARLRWFVLDETIHGSGVGHLLMDQAMSFVEATRYTHVVLGTIEGLEAACRLYEKHGFQQTDRTLNDCVYGPPINTLEYIWERRTLQD